MFSASAIIEIDANWSNTVLLSSVFKSTDAAAMDHLRCQFAWIKGDMDGCEDSISR